jgi:fimbrial chaperone protein
MENRIRFALAMVALLVCLSGARPANAGNYGVSPLDFQFSAQRRSGVLTITNEDKAAISLRVRAMRWTQNAEGADVYEESNDLVFFPKRVELPPGEKKIVRLGVNAVPQDGERAYRLFVDELPSVEEPGQASGTRLAVLVSIGVPVFLTPEGAKAGLEVEQATLGQALDMTVNNRGQKRVRISRIVASDGAEVAQNIPGRYVFPGVRKAFRIQATSSVCATGRASLRVDADGAMTDFNAACAR